MVSASVSAAVSMMMGAETPAPRRAAHLAPVHVRQPDIEQHRVEALLGGDVKGAAARLRLPAVKGFNQPELLRQGLAQRLVVIYQEQAPVRGRSIHCRGGHQIVSLFTRASARGRSVRAA